MSTLKSFAIPSCFMILFSVAVFANTDNVSPSESSTARISMLEKALAPKTPAAVAHLFAEANKNRNGAVQFMLFSESLKNKYKDSWPYWVSGTSSPWITSYEVKKMKQTPTAWTFQITYQWATASGPFQPPLKQTIVVAPVPKNKDSSQKWQITTFKEK